MAARRRSANKDTPVTIKGKKRTAGEWADKLGIPWSTISGRVRRGMTLQGALTQKPAPRSARPPLTIDGETMSVLEWGRRYGVSRQLLDNRIASGWPVLKAATTPPRSGAVKRLTRKQHRERLALKRKVIRIDGEPREAREWAKVFGLSRQALEARLLQDWKPLLAVTTPTTVPRHIPALRLNGKTRTAEQWAKQRGFGMLLVHKRMREGMSLKKAVTTPASGRK